MIVKARIEREPGHHIRIDQCGRFNRVRGITHWIGNVLILVAKGFPPRFQRFITPAIGENICLELIERKRFCPRPILPGLKRGIDLANQVLCRDRGQVEYLLAPFKVERTVCNFQDIRSNEQTIKIGIIEHIEAYCGAGGILEFISHIAMLAHIGD